MFAILFCTVVGFLAGLAFLMIRRQIKPNKMLAATFSGLFAAGAYKLFKEYSRNKRKWRDL